MPIKAKLQNPSHPNTTVTDEAGTVEHVLPVRDPRLVEAARILDGTWNDICMTNPSFGPIQFHTKQRWQDEVEQVKRLLDDYLADAVEVEVVEVDAA